MTILAIETRGVRDWRSRLADPEKQWKRGYSAFEAAILVFSLVFAPLQNATAEVDYTEDAQILIRISGQIKIGDAEKLASVIQRANDEFNRSPRALVYVLNSLGGDTATAIRMGRMMRTAPFRPHVYIPGNATCGSSCVFLLAAGTGREVKGRVGIHRPYLSDDKAQSAGEQKNQYQSIGSEIKGYLTEVNITTVLYDEMIRISPTKIKYLTQIELERYGLNQPDPYADSAEIARFADGLKITSAEFIKRSQKAEQVCGAQTLKNTGCWGTIWAGREYAK